MRKEKQAVNSVDEIHDIIIEKGNVGNYIEHGDIDAYSLDVRSWSDYYAFGMPMTGRSYSAQEYRFGFNGMEKDPEITGQEGSHYTAAFWEYDTRIARRWNVDPVTYPWQSSYAVFNNNPIIFTDPLGLFGRREDARNYKKEHGIKGRVRKGDDGSFYIRTKSGYSVYDISQNTRRANTDHNAETEPAENFTGMYADYVGEVSGWYKFWHSRGGEMLKNPDFPNGYGASRKGNPSNSIDTRDIPGAPGKYKNVKLPKTTYEWYEFIMNAEKNAEKAKSIIDRTEDAIERNNSDGKPVPETSTSEQNKQQQERIHIYFHTEFDSVYDGGVTRETDVSRTPNNLEILKERGRSTDKPLNPSEYNKLN